MRVWLIGESNPYQRGPRPEFDLYPDPPQSAGARLCRILGYDPKEPDDYLEAFERRNLLYGGGWSASRAREAAVKLLEEEALRGDAFVLLGAKVSTAFGLPFAPLSAGKVRAKDVYLHPANVFTALVVPHPSGLSRAWNDPTMAPRVRAAVEALRSTTA